MYSWCFPIAGQVTCRSRVSASSGNHSRASSAHWSSATGGPPGLIPAASAAAMYLLAVLRSTPRLCAISLLLRPACQWTRISMMSTTSKVLLAIGPPAPRPGQEECCSCPDGQVQPDTHVVPMGNYVTGLGNYVIATALPAGIS